MKTRTRVLLYTRPGCHLCEEAKREIKAAGYDDLYELEEINIDDDPTLAELYGWEIPVVTINGIKAFKYRLTAAEFKSKLIRLTSSGRLHGSN
jgi:glutaredoxin